MRRRELLGGLLAAAACGIAGAATAGCVARRDAGAEPPSPAPESPEPEVVCLTSTPFAMETGIATAATPSPPTITETLVLREPNNKPSPTEERRQAMVQVSFVRTRDREQGVNRAIDLLDLGPMSGMHLFVKPNFNSADPTPGSTHEDTLVALVRRLRAMGADGLTVGDRSGMGDTRRVMDQKGIFQMGDELGFAVIAFDDLDESGWEKVELADGHWTRGFAVARPVLEADGVVQTCCLKTHQYGGHFTMALKNSVGLVAKQVPGDSYNYMTELHSSSYQREMIAEINTAYEPALIVMDGVQAFVTRGPDTGKTVEPQVVLASTDRVAIDAVGVAILRYFGTTEAVSRGPIFGQAQIARAVELGLGVAAPEQIELVTGDTESAAFAAEIRRVLDLG